MRALIIGGSKSGKSGFAQELVLKLANGGRSVYWATMDPTDEEDEARIMRHLEDRFGLGFETVECGRNVLNAVNEAKCAFVLFDSVTALLANEMFSGGSVDAEAGVRIAEELLELSNSAESFVSVCDNIFCDGTVYEELTEQYRRSLAFVIRRLAEEFDTVCEVVCGIPKVIKGELPGGLCVE